MLKKKSTKTTGLKTDQKLTLLAVSIVMVFLISLVVWRKSSFQVNNTGPSQQQVQKIKDQQEAYKKLLESIKPDKDASQKLLKQLVTEDEIRKQIESELQVDQKIVLPEVSDREIQITSDSSKDSLVGYFKNIAANVASYNKAVIPVSVGSFQSNSTVAEIDGAIANSDLHIASLRQVTVPRELVGFHKSQLISVYSHKKLLELARDYRVNGGSPWADVYKQYYIANKELEIADNEFKKVDAKYNISSISLIDASTKYTKFKELFQIKEAHALLGVGDTTVIVGNLPEQIKDGIKQGFASAYGHFATKFLKNLIGTIEKNYKIANFLYYSDSLSKGQYIPNYLDKYVLNPADREIVKRFIPQFSCGVNQNASLRPILQAKAEEYLGFDPSGISANDPQFEIKMARVGEFLASPNGWQNYYDGVALNAQSEAEKAITRELTSSGLKNPRDLLDSQISASLSVIEGSQVAALISSLQLGAVNAENLISQLVTSVLDSLVTKFVFKGAVFVEDNSCAPIPVLNPVIPADADTARSADFNPNAGTSFRGGR